MRVDRHSLGQLAAAVVPALILAAHLAVMLVYTWRWDKASALTVVPFWLWGISGSLLAGTWWVLFRNRLSAVVALIWIVTTLACSDESLGLARFFAERPEPGNPEPFHGSRVIRVITLNCKKHNSLSAQEAAAYRPDILLLQETPSAPWLQKFARELYGPSGQVVASGWDCSIVTGGRVKVRPGTPPYFAQAEVSIEGTRFEVVSLHLHGAETALSLHRIATWKRHYQRHQIRGSQLRNIFSSIRLHAPSRPCLIGGDFNAPAGDRIFEPLRQNGFQDAFHASGSGWGNTVTNDYPLHRIDQIWVTGLFEPVRATAVPTAHSDHRMLVCDFVLRPE